MRFPYQRFCLFLFIFLSLFLFSGLYAQESVHDREVIMKVADGVIVWPGQAKSHLISDLIFESDSLQNIFSSYEDILIERMFNEDDPEEILVTNPAGLITTKPTLYGHYKIHLKSAEDAIQLKNVLINSKEIIWAYRNSCAIFQSTPNDTLFDEQWALKNTGQNGGVAGRDINIEPAWDYTTGSDSTVVAIVDGYIDRYHNDLNGRIFGNIGSGSGWHGTHVAGIIGANTNNTEGIAGIDRHARLLSMWIPDTMNSTGFNAWKIVEAIDSGSNIINLSYAHYGEDHIDERMALRYAYNMNQFVSAPAGNDPNQVNPAKYVNVFAVAAFINNGHHAFYSNTGSWIDVSAPGGNYLGEPTAILTTAFNDQYTWDFGQTSAAAAHVSGVASLLKSYNHNLWNDDIVNILRISAEDVGILGWDSAYGWGEIDAEAALEMIALPNIVMQATAENGYTYNVSGPYVYSLIGIPWIDPLLVWNVMVYEIRKDVVFDQEFESIIGAWGRGAASNGYRLTNPNHGWFYSEVVPESVTNTGMTMKTYVFEIRSLDGYYFGFSPCTPSEATMAYTVVGVPSCYGMCGDANADGTVNVNDAVYIINYVFIGGAPPQPIRACGNANGDSSVNVSDASFLTNYIFVAGAQPPGDCNPAAFPETCCPFEE